MIREDVVKILSPYMKEINKLPIDEAFYFIEDLGIYDESFYITRSIGDYKIELNSKGNIVELGVMEVAVRCGEGNYSYIKDYVFLGICFSSNDGELEWFHHHGYDIDVRDDIYALPFENRVTTIIPITPQGCIDELNHIKNELIYLNSIEELYLELEGDIKRVNDLIE